VLNYVHSLFIHNKENSCILIEKEVDFIDVKKETTNMLSP